MTSAALRLTATTGLDATILPLAQALVHQANSAAGTVFPLLLRPTLPRDSGTPHYILSWQGAHLVGLVELVGYQELEGFILVASTAWRQGIGRQLAAAAAADLAQRGISDWLLVTSGACPAGVPFALALGGELRHAEHQLRYAPAARTPAPVVTPLRLQPATAADSATIAAILAAAFNDTVDTPLTWLGPDFNRTDRQWFLGQVGSSAVGCLRIIRSATSADLTAFGVLPTQQGRGYGRALLQQAVALLVSEGVSTIQIETETLNAAALHLYQDCGFVIDQTYGYYHLPAPLTAHTQRGQQP